MVCCVGVLSIVDLSKVLMREVRGMCRLWLLGLRLLCWNGGGACWLVYACCVRCRWL